MDCTIVGKRNRHKFCYKLSFTHKKINIYLKLGHYRECSFPTNKNVSNANNILHRMITNAELGGLWQGVFFGLYR